MIKRTSNARQFFYLHLHPSDNVVVLTDHVNKNTQFQMGGSVITIKSEIQLGHKVAIIDIQPGEKIVKCGTAIGSATEAISAGNHVHLHNMKSDYLPTYTLKDPYHG